MCIVPSGYVIPTADGIAKHDGIHIILAGNSLPYTHNAGVRASRNYYFFIVQ